MEELELEEFSLRDEDGNEVTDQEVFGGCNTLLAFLEEGAEPTEHFLNELRERRQEIRESGLRMVWAVTGKEALSNPTLAEVRKLLGAQIYTTISSRFRRSLREGCTRIRRSFLWFCW